MSFSQAITEVNRKILRAELAAAEKALQALRPAHKVEYRIIGHYQAILLFHKGDIPKAREVLQYTLDTYGENVNLLRDLVSCHYNLQDMLGFRSHLARLEAVLKEFESQLSSRSLLECELMVGKFLEEDARLAPAFDFYERAVRRAENPPQRLRALIQKARWLALYKPSPELSSLYRELISFPLGQMTADLTIELEHSLMLVELRLVGSDHAWHRIQRLAPGTPEIDRRLMVFDYVEDAMTQDLELPPTVLKIMSEFKNLDPYEEYIAKLACNQIHGSGRIQELTLLATLLPWASYLRLLCLTANIENNMTTRQELNRKIQLIVRGLDQDSQNLWNQRLKQALQNPEIKIEYNSRQRSISVQGRLVDLTKKKSGLQLLDGLIHKSTLTVDEAIEMLWKTSFTPEHYHRLRMSIHRLNTLIHKTTGFGKVLEVDSQNVRLRPEVILQKSDETFDFKMESLGI